MDTSLSAEEALFYEALQIADPEERQAFLASACGDNDELHRAIDDLLASHTSAEAFFRDGSSELKPPDELNAGPIGHEAMGTWIGPYRLSQRLGEGGGGVVYMAEQEVPVRRQVALKIIKLGMDTRRVIARFELERQTLALMEHPNIARVFDAGATETGRPFFVMELVRGIKITDYCSQNGVSLHDRLTMFQQVCHAIQHAHQKGVIHRDIKPANILVTLQDGMPTPKVIDFGIAKATEAQRGEGTAFTVNEQLIGTPAYMSPEQVVGGMDVDTRSDIYSLGVVFYELIAGRPPFNNKELLSLGLDEMRRVLRDQDPPRPSDVALQPKGGAETLPWTQNLRGDLDWIAMKALEKDRERRYQTARGFAIDIERYLNDEPIQARPPSRLYRLQKLVSRNKATFAAGGTTVLALMAGFAISTWLFFRASDAERQQKQLRAVAEEALLREADLRRRAEEREKVTRAAILLSERKIVEADALLGDKSFHLSQPSLEATGVFRALATWNALKKNWSKAALYLLALIQVNRFDENDQTDNATRDLLPVAPTLIEARDLQTYDKVRRLAISRFGRSNNPVAAEQILKISMLTPPGSDVLSSIKGLARVAEDSVKDHSIPRDYLESWRFAILGLYKYRCGDYQAAWDWSQRSLAFSERVMTRDAIAHLVQAMSAWRLGRRAEADSLLWFCSMAVSPRLAAPVRDHDADRSIWSDWLDVGILLREAEALIHGESGKSANKSE
ncbi:MAG TPA: serine/threonine-protein kinase [Chthoniobacterales bacterium]